MPAADQRPRTVILLQYAGIGDLVWHIPYFERIAQGSQGGKVTVVAQPSTRARDFIAQEAWVEDVLDHDHRPRRSDKRRGQHAGLMGMWRMAQTLRAGRYDRIFLFSGRPSRGLIAALSGIPQRLGFGYRRLQRIFLNQGPYIAAYKGPSLAVYPEASAFMVAQGYCDAPVRPFLTPPAHWVRAMQDRLQGLPRPWHVLAIGTSETHKQWGKANYLQLATALLEEGGSVIFSGGPAEAKLAQEMACEVAQALQPRVRVVTDVPVLGSAAALSMADCCVGNDTGMVNVAAAVGCPTLVLIGSRPTLDHDPALLHNFQAKRLPDIDVQAVLERVRALVNHKPDAPVDRSYSS